jgi:hypothetical protein
MLKKFAFVAILFAATACSSVYQLAIEVQEPAPITLPGNTNHILIVNNTTPQPNGTGINRTYNGKPVTAYELDLDSVSWITIEALSATIRKAHFFDQISLYKHLARGDKEWMSLIPLPEEYRNKLFGMQDFDVIVSVDRLLFNGEEDVKDNTRELSGEYIHAFVSNKVEGMLNYSIYLYEKDSSLHPFTITDSIIYKSTLMTDSLEFFKILPEEIIDDLAYTLGEKLAYSIIPTWTVQMRTIYTGSPARMKEAFSYSKNGRWDKAESIWLNLFDKESKNAIKAKIANNLAVANEMQDNPEAALHWAEKAKIYLPVGSKEGIAADEYITVLQQRIRNNRLLDIQLRETF